MSARIESHGDIEIVCQTAELAPNKMAHLVFRLFGDAHPPFEIQIKSPSGKVILRRVMRELPTGEPQSPPPISFSVQRGEYHIQVSQLKGSAEGHATLVVQ
jgi:hypothetical protein